MINVINVNDASLCAFFLNFCDDATVFFLPFCDDATAFCFHRLVVSVKLAIVILADNSNAEP